MSLDLINHKLTTSTTDSKGVTTWSNPVVKDTINSKGEVFSKFGKKKTKGVSGHYSITLLGVKGSIPASFNSMFSRMVLGIKLQGSTLKKKSNTVGYLPENMEVVPLTEINLKRNQKVGQHAKVHQEHLKVAQKQLSLETPKIEMKPNSNKQYYTVYEAMNEHTTEDGAVFPTKELAEWHQTKVTKGKGNAQVVLDYNGGFVLAEQIYLQEVVYNKAKPYTNFIDVLNNNQGIVSVVQEEHCKFDKLDNEHGLSTVQLNLFGLGKVINIPCTKVQAEKINTSLNKYSEAFSKLEDEHKTLKDLLKQVS